MKSLSHSIRRPTIEAEGEPDRSYLNHEALIALTADGDRERLSAMMRAHILRTKDNYLNAFEKMSSGKGDAV